MLYVEFELDSLIVLLVLIDYLSYHFQRKLSLNHKKKSKQNSQ